MSIKILRVTTDDSRLILFLLVSIVLHIGILFVVPQAREAKKVLPRLIPVDVIELPKPAEIQEKKPEVRSQKPAPANSKIKPALSVKQEKREPLTNEKRIMEKKPDAETQGSEEKKKILPLEAPLKQEKPLTLFPTKERISELSKEYEKQIPVGEKGRDISFDTSESRFSSYFEVLRSKIYHEWEYPDAAARDGQAGRLWVRFIIKKDGTLEEIILIRGSGYPMLDDAALSAIRLAAPFYSFPKNFGSLERITINASFEYILENLPPLIKNRH